MKLKSLVLLLSALAAAAKSKESRAALRPPAVPLVAIDRIPIPYPGFNDGMIAAKQRALALSLAR